METSILTSTKKVLGIAESYTVFDLDIITHINAVFSILYQLGVGPVNGFMIEDASMEWEDFAVPTSQVNLIKTYLFLKVSLLFDPPTTSFLLDAKKEQIAEYEWRLNVARENDIPYPLPEEVIACL
jgi:hypothetical protein